ncbi:hypothetical protein HOY82DRAFT_538792 [Tuber indicum]|nr:hypothetical protein HOY82DRAFT_538792 [Tuber indicum]
MESRGRFGIFGSLAVFFISLFPRSLRDGRFSPHSAECVIIGYTNSTKIWHHWYVQQKSKSIDSAVTGTAETSRSSKIHSRRLMVSKVYFDKTKVPGRYLQAFPETEILKSFFLKEEVMPDQEIYSSIQSALSRQLRTKGQGKSNEVGMTLELYFSHSLATSKATALEKETPRPESAPAKTLDHTPPASVPYLNPKLLTVHSLVQPRFQPQGS